MMERTEEFWDAQAATFDEQPDHGLRDPNVRAAWTRLLLQLMPPAPASVVGVGCGTGSLAVLLAERGHQVCGVDLSGRMLGAADVVLARHVLWALPDPAAALARWVAGLPAAYRRTLVLRRRQEATVQRLDDPALWGAATEDERYLVVSRT